MDACILRDFFAYGTLLIDQKPATSYLVILFCFSLKFDDILVA